MKITDQLKLVLVSITLLTASGCASHRYVVTEPGIPPDSWEKVDAQATGTEVAVLLQTGLGISGSFQGSTRDGLILRTDTGTETTIAKTDVRRVSTASADALDNGILWGIVVGGFMGVVSLQAGNAAGTAGSFALFTSLPILYDWSRQEHEVLYGGP